MTASDFQRSAHPWGGITLHPVVPQRHWAAPLQTAVDANEQDTLVLSVFI